MTRTLRSLTPYNVAQMIDISAVKPDSTDDRIREVVLAARSHNCYLLTVLPSQTARAKELISDSPTPKLGGNVGFPSGGQTSAIKVAETRELVRIGVDEIDMVIDISAHLSGRYDDVQRGIAAVVDAADGKPVKVILECYYLDEKLIRIGCDMAIKAGAAYIKTGTGWTPVGATLDNVSIIKRHVGDAIKIKASGGIRDIHTLLDLRRRGASRFGISLNAAVKILGMLEHTEQPIRTNERA